MVHPHRIAIANAAPVCRRGRYVLYWMIGARRTTWSFALEHAVARAIELDRPLVVLEALRVDYPWACDRFHRFVLDGMDDNAAAFERAGAGYLRYVEPEVGAGRGLLAALAARAACVVTDEAPGFFLPRMVAATAARLPVRVEVVDGVGIVPLRAIDRAMITARAFRRAAAAPLREHASRHPAARPLAKLPRALRDPSLPAAILRRWKSARDLAALPIDHAVPPIARRGGSRAAAAALARFVDERLDDYGQMRRDPLVDTTSGLSPYLHFGHISAHEVAARVRARGPSPAVDKFLDELITWRELGQGFAFHRGDHDRYQAVPGWARASLAAHAHDRRAELYTRDQLAAARTGDPIWNAAQRQLLRDGVIDTYLRMLWGKKVIEWSRTPEEAFATLVDLNNRYAIDGRDPNSYCGILWCFGAFDRPWGPERPIYGLVRYMSSANTARKLRLGDYLARYA
jgi:deoxyribodipyrimidine photo-lyase